MPTDRPPKPDTAAIRDEINRPIRVEGPVAISPSAVCRMADTVAELCDYIDSLTDEYQDIKTRLEYYRCAVRPKVKDLPPEGAPILGRTWLEDMPGKVTVEQVRKYVESYDETGARTGLYYNWRNEILDFIDNGPKKPTAEDVIEECINSDYMLSGNRIARALRDAGYLKDEA